MHRMLTAFLLLAALAAAPSRAAPPFVYGPYQHLAQSIDRNTMAIALPADVKTLTWAFAVGECGAETWNGLDAQKIADTNVAPFDRAGIGYILATGGEGGVFTCGSDAGMEAFIARYASPRLLGIDFDIEAKQTPEQVDALVQRAVAARAKHPQLRFSFTLPTFASSDGSARSLNAQGERVLQAIRQHALDAYTINLMVMDFGDARAANCVVKQGRCDMAASAVQAALNLHRHHGVPLSHIELTPMIGVNDVAANVFRLDDARVLAHWVREQGLAGLHFWSLDRDAPCTTPTPDASATCSGLDAAPRAFTRALTP
jgi:chitinase